MVVVVLLIGHKPSGDIQHVGLCVAVIHSTLIVGYKTIRPTTDYSLRCYIEHIVVDMERSLCLPPSHVRSCLEDCWNSRYPMCDGLFTV